MYEDQFPVIGSLRKTTLMIILFLESCGAKQGDGELHEVLSCVKSLVQNELKRCRYRVTKIAILIRFLSNMIFHMVSKVGACAAGFHTFAKHISYPRVKSFVYEAGVTTRDSYPLTSPHPLHV
jgi:hypothetical protein